MHTLRGSTSPGTGKRYSLSLILKVFDLPRSTFYDGDKKIEEPKSPPSGKKRGPKTAFSDEQIVHGIRQVIGESHFSGEGHRKVRARLLLIGLHAGKDRVLRLMRLHGLLAPSRSRRVATKRVHDGRIITDSPNICWGGDITDVMTVLDGKVSIIGIIDHCTDEVLSSHVVKSANRFEAVESLHQAMEKEFGIVGKDVARGTVLRVDHGSQFTSNRYVNESRHLGFDLSFSFVGQPECNGIIERWHRTLKEQLLWTRTWKNVSEVRQAVADFVKLYNEEWLIERHGYLSPRQFKKTFEKKGAA